MKNFIEELNGRKARRVPFWFMRQAGRYLPEYRALREKTGGFLEMAMNPDLAAEITLQPIRRFGMDAAIIFSDILVVPMALGQKLWFEAGEGPRLGSLPDEFDFENFHARLEPVYESLRTTKNMLGAEGFHETALIGFSGAPWTLAAYMIEGRGSKDFTAAKKYAYQNPEKFSALLKILTRAIVEYLVRKIDSGAEAVQLFDSWAGLLTPAEFQKWCVAPTREIVEAVRAQKPDIPIIGFPRAAGFGYADYARHTGVTAVGMDQYVPLDYVCKTLQPLALTQGALDPALLLVGGRAMEDGARGYLEALSGGGYIFNLGHGVHKDTPPEHVARLAEIIRNYERS